MTTKSELIARLQEIPGDPEIRVLYDGNAFRENAEVVYLARGGYIVIAGHDNPAYHEEDRPLSAPTEAEEKYWYTP